MDATTRTLIAAGLLLAVAFAVPAGAVPVGACVEDVCQEVQVGPENGASCSVSADGSGVLAECHGA